MKILVNIDDIQVDICNTESPSNFVIVNVLGSLPILLQYSTWQELIENHPWWTYNIVYFKTIEYEVYYSLISSTQNIIVGSDDVFDLFSLRISSSQPTLISDLKISINQNVIEYIEIYENNVLKQTIYPSVGSYYYSINNISINTTQKILKFTAKIKQDIQLESEIYNTSVMLEEIRTFNQTSLVNNVFSTFIVDNYINSDINVTYQINNSQVTFNIEYNSNEYVKYVCLKSNISSTFNKSMVEDKQLSLNETVGDWTVVYIGEFPVYTDHVVENVYNYYVFLAFDNYLNYSNYSMKEIYVDTLPPNPVENLITSRIDESNSYISFSYLNPSYDAYKILIFRSKLNIPPILQNGTDYTQQQNSLQNYDLIYYTSNIINEYNIVDSTISTPESLYYYVYVSDTTFNYSIPVISSIEEFTIEFIPVVNLFYDESANKYYVIYSKNNQVILEEVLIT